MTNRERKALEIAARMRIIQQERSWLVPSQTGPGHYRVDLDAPSCTCEDFATRNLPCKHILAVRLVQDREAGVVPPAPPPDPEAKPPTYKPTYKQNWPAYNRAQTHEKHRFQVLLADLCRGIKEPPAAHTGRPRVPLADAVFATAYKVYSTVSSRRFNCDLQDAHEAGYLSRPIHCNRVNEFLEREEMTPVLQNLITVSSLPLRSVEVHFAPDSSGFSSSRFLRWYDKKYGTERKQASWVKAHIVTGVKTNVITAVEIHDQRAADGPQFPSLITATAANFRIKEVSADKAYLSSDNLELVDRLGGTAFIPFKSNNIGDSNGPLWKQMFHYFQFRREEFLGHYHKRSNVESTFAMLKAKFRDHVLSRTEPAMTNEVLCKVLCHNIVVVIHEQEELGIAANFWDDDTDGPAILPMHRRS